MSGEWIPGQGALAGVTWVCGDAPMVGTGQGGAKLHLRRIASGARFHGSPQAGADNVLGDTPNRVRIACSTSSGSHASNNRQRNLPWRQE